MNQNKGKCGCKMPQCMAAILTRKKEYPLIDYAIVAYVGIVLFFQILLQISPVMTFLATTPLYSVQTYLGVLGGFLIVVDCFTTKRLWQGKYCLFLLVILVLAAVSSVRTLSYGMRENLFKLCWMAIQFTLMYTCAFRLRKEQFKKCLKILFYVLLTIWFVACCVSLYQYVNQIGYRYVVNPLAQDASANRQGFFDNRLFGIFYTLNHAAYISLFFLVIAVIFAVREKRLWVRIYLVVASLALLSYIILSGSRSAMISLVACGAVMPWFTARNMIKRRGAMKPILCCVVALASVAMCYFGYGAMKKGLSQVPYLKELFIYNMQVNNPDSPITDPTDPTADPTDPTDITEEPTEPLETPEYDEDILNRDYLDEDISNDRMDIWTDYISLYKEIGLMGLSPGNYMPYIMENHADLYIVDYIKNHYPDKYESGIIYHVHSGFLMVYVSAGILGFASLVIFVLLYLKRLIAMILKNKKLSGLFIGAAALIVSGVVSAVFDEGLFFQNNLQTTMFWIALGVLTCEPLIKPDGQEEDNA